jgi:hypothetical protein
MNESASGELPKFSPIVSGPDRELRCFFSEEVKQRVVRRRNGSAKAGLFRAPGLASRQPPSLREQFEA